MNIKVDGKQKEMLVFKTKTRKRPYEWCIFNGIREPEKMDAVSNNLLKSTDENDGDL